MYRDNREDFFNLVPINIISSKFLIKIIGGGKAAYIKAKGLLEKGCFVHILSKEFSEEVLSLKNSNLTLETGIYYKEFIKNSHLVIIAVDDYKLVKEICNDCDDEYKIYINSSDYRNGIGSIPYSKSYKNLSFSISSKLGSPKVTRYIGKEIERIVEKNDDYSIIVANIRNKAKLEENKKDIIDFISGKKFKKAIFENREFECLKNTFGEEVSKRLMNIK